MSAWKTFRSFSQLHASYNSQVNVVMVVQDHLKIYCKRGYFRWGKCWQDISHGGNFHDITHISFIKAYGFYFCVGVFFGKKTKA